MAYLQSEDGLSALDRDRYLDLTGQKNKLLRQQSQLNDQLAKTPAGTTAARQLELQLGDLQDRIAELTDSQRQCYLWKIELDCPFSLLLAGETLVAGGENEVVALRAADGQTLCHLPVAGKAYGLSVANGRLYASTDQGVVHCFGQPPNGPTRSTTAAPAEQISDTEKPNTACRELVERLLKMTDIRQGYCLLLGCEDGSLACELVRQTSLRIVCVEPDAEKVAAARRRLDRAGYYGTRVSIRHGTLDRLPYPDFFANLIISGTTLASATLPPSTSEIVRMLRPSGGTALVGQVDGYATGQERLTRAELSDWIGRGPAADWTIGTQGGLWAELRRAPISGSGQWTHLYADAANSACSKDTVRGPLRLQWFGQPGPRHMVDRHHRPMSPLCKDGRLFVLGDNRIITLDAYNGTHLWQREVPESRRVGVMKDCGQMVVTDGNLWIAAGSQCWGLDVSDGTRRLTLGVPAVSDRASDWGYLHCTDNQIIGSAQRQGASFRALGFRGDPNNGSALLEGDFRQVIISHALFSLDPRTSETTWVYRNGAIMNSTIAVGEGRIYFVESRAPDIANDRDGRVRIDRFCEKQLYLVALDMQTGQTSWERAVRLPFQHIMFLCYSDNLLICNGTCNEKSQVYYDLFAFDADGGEQKWHTRYQALDIRGTQQAPTEGSHGEQWQHPVINGDTIYCRPFAFDLETGQKKAYAWPRGGHGCGGATGSAYCLFGRGGNPRYYPLDVPQTDGIPLTEITRPGCWINIIPAGGLVLIPESSSGCTCEYPVQTSLAFAPGANHESGK
jgi:outer membrane protein assembly factor BamB